MDLNIELETQKSHIFYSKQLFEDDSWMERKDLLSIKIKHFFVYPINNGIYCSISMPFFFSKYSAMKLVFFPYHPFFLSIKLKSRV